MVLTIASRIPKKLGGGSPGSANTAIYKSTGIHYTIALNGLPFILQPTKDNPLIRKTHEYKKDQVDQSNEPGEQSIAQWWIHAQSSFHLGAGQKYADTPVPQGGDVAKLRYSSSYGVDPWVEGQLTLLRQTQMAFSAASATLLTADADGTSTQMLVANGSVLSRVTETVAAGVPTYTSASVTWGGSGTILGLTTDGTNYYAANATGVYKGTLTGVSPGTGTLLCSWPSSVNNVVLGYVKARVIAAINVGGGSPASAVYTLPISGALPSPNYTHYNTQWKWTAVADGPESILISGYSGNRSEVLKFVLDTQGAMPTLTGGATAALMPSGELVLGMATSLGSTIGISTSRGVRIGQFNPSGGGFALGPRSVSSRTLGGGIAFSGDWYFAGGTHDDGVAGCYRVETSQQISIKQFSYTPDQRFGWATDVRAADSEVPVTGQASVVATMNDGRACFLVPGRGLYVTWPDRKVTSGTLTTSKIRYNTLDPKLMRFIRIRGEAANTTDSGWISVTVNPDDEPGQQAGILVLAQKNDTGDLSSDVRQAVSAQVTFTLYRSSTDNTVSPLLTSYQLKALPAQRRQRDVVLPLQIYDHEKDNSGTRIGGDGSALRRLLALEALEQSSDIVTLQFLGATNDQDLTELVVIDSIEYHMTSDSTERQNWGGMAVVSCHTVT